MTRRRPTDTTSGLVQTRRSMGDGTVKGRSRIATPYDPRRLKRPGSVVQPRRGGPDPRTITVEAADVEVPAGVMHPLEWQGATGGRTLYRVEEPDYPATEVEVPSTGVWSVRIELEWEDVHVGSEFRGGGNIEVRVAGLPRWPAGEGTTEPPRPGWWPLYQGSTPELLLVRGEPVEVLIRHDDDEPRTLKRALVTLAQLEPLSRSAPVSTEDPTDLGEHECTVTGPTLWVRFHGPDGDDQLTNMMADSEDHASWSASPVFKHSISGPYGPAPWNITGNWSNRDNVGGGLEGTDDACDRGTQTAAMMFLLGGTGGGYMLSRKPGTGAASGETAGRRFVKGGEDSIRYEIRHSFGNTAPLSQWTIPCAPNTWHAVVATHDPDDGRVLVWLDGTLVVDDFAVQTGDPGTGRQLVMRGEDALQSSSLFASRCSVAEIITYGSVLSPADVGKLFAMMGTP